MERIREGRRSNMPPNGMTRRRHRTNSLRDSPDEDGPMELQEPTRLRDRGAAKKDRDRLGRTKRRRGDRVLMHTSREDAGEDSSDDSINDHEEDDDDDDDIGGGGGGGSSVRMLPLNPSSSPSLSNHHRKSFPPAKVFRPAPPMTWKAADEMIGVSVPRKARSASTKRSHECWASSGGIAAEQNHRQVSTSPVRLVTATAMASPSSSNASVRKKIKANGGPKLRPPKSSSKSSSSVQEEIEIEIAEVLYGMMRQPQGPSNQEIMANDSREVNNKSSSDGKSRISSPVSNSQSAPPQNSSSSATPMSAVAPKRKRPRPVKPEDENPAIFSIRSSPISSTTKAESDQPSKIENCRSNMDKNNPGSAPECLTNSQLEPPPPRPEPPPPRPEPIKPESNVSSDSKALTDESEKQKDVGLSKEVVPPHSPKKESSVLQVDGPEDVKATKASSTMSEIENQREEKFQIDLMAPPPPLRSSPERDVEINLVVDAEKEVETLVEEDEKPLRMSEEDVVDVEMDKVRAKAEDAESQKPAIVQRERVIDLQLDLEKADKGNTAGSGTMVNKKQHQNLQRQQQQQTNTEKNVQSNSVPLPMSVPSWPGGLPPMGYMAPLQGVVSMDGTTVTPAAIPPPHLLFNQPRPKRCATHCYIARNILYHQQIARMNPFWPAAGGSASLYGAKPSNLNVVRSPELHANVPGRNSTQDKGHSLTMFPGHIGKDKGSQPANMDNSSRKQILLQQALPPGAAPNNILHGPAFIFPLNQQQAAAAAAASVRPGSMKSLPVTSNETSSCTSSSALLNASGTGAAATAAPTMSFSYPNLPGNETQYLAILQNNAYSFPIPAHVGGPAAYRGTHAQAFPFFNGSFYPSQMLHPSQIQQQLLPAQSQPSQQQGHQNTSISSGSSSSQKHAQHQQQKPNNPRDSNGTASGAGASLQGFPVTKTPSSQPLQLQQRQQIQNHHSSHPARQIESEMVGEDSPSTADSRLTRATMNIYGQNFAMPMQTPNIALMTPASVTGAGSNGSHGEKKQPQMHSGPKAGVETSQAFSMSFASISGATASAATGLDLSSISQNHSIMQSHHNYPIMAAAHAASSPHKKNYLAPEEGKTVVNSSNTDEDRKGTLGKSQATVGQSTAFSRSDVSDSSKTSLAGNVIDSLGRSLNLGSAPRTSSSVMPSALITNAASSQQLQRNQPQILQLQKQHQFAAARNKTPSASNGSVYSDSLPSTSSMATKFPNAVSVFPQSLVQSSSTVAQSPQWKNSARPTTSQPSPSMASTPPSSVNKMLPQQQARSLQAHTQISFAANPKSSTTQVQQPPSSSQSPSTPVMVGSPTTSSVSKNTGSPRTTTSTNNKISQASSFSSQQPKNSPAVPSRISSPVGARNVPSILSSPQLTPSSTTGTKSQLPHQQQQKQQQVSKQTLPQAQLFFSNPYMHSQVSQTSSSNSATSAASGYYLQRRGSEQMQRPGSSGSSSNGAAVNNTKGSALPTQGLMHPAQFAAMSPSGNPHQFVPAGFPYVHPVPSTVQVKPADQKQPAGE